MSIPKGVTGGSGWLVELDRDAVLEMRVHAGEGVLSLLPLLLSIYGPTAPSLSEVSGEDDVSAKEFAEIRWSGVRFYYHGRGVEPEIAVRVVAGFVRGAHFAELRKDLRAEVSGFTERAGTV